MRPVSMNGLGMFTDKWAMLIAWEISAFSAVMAVMEAAAMK